MKLGLTYSPEGQGPQSWVVDIDDIDNLEAEDIEVVGGGTWDSYGEWFGLMGRGNMRAIRALLWILLKRNNPQLDFNEVRFRTSELASEVIDDEAPEGKEEVGDSDTGSPPPETDSAAS